MFRDCVRTAEAYVPGEQPQDGVYVKLNTNENPFAPTPLLSDAITKASLSLNRYPEPTSRIVRSAVSELCKVREEQVVVGNGSDELLSLLIRSIINPGEAVGTLDVTYSLYKVLVSLQGGYVVEYATDESFKPLPTPDVIHEKLIFLASPNAPAGDLLPEEWVRDVCRKAPGIVVIDEAYVDFASRNHLSFVKSFDNVVITRTLSKGYALAGLRLGYAVTSEKIARELHKVRDSYNVDRVAQEIGAVAIRDQAYYKQNWSTIIHLRKELAHTLTGLDFTVLPSEANFLLARPHWISGADLYKALKERKVLVRHFSSPRITDYVRITVGTESEMSKLVEVLGELKGV